MRIGVWNLDYAPQSKSSAIDSLLKDKNADIWVLTETRRDIFADDSGYRGVHSDGRPVENAKAKTEDRWSSVWSRYGIEQVKFEGDQPAEIDGQHVNRLRRTCAHIEETPIGELIVYAMVMPWPGSKKDEWLAALGFFSKEWEVLKSKYPEASLIIAGDFNTTFNEKIFPWEGAKALEEELLKRKLRCVTHSFASADNPMIDHIAAPQGWRAEVPRGSYWAADENQLSDHSGMVVELPRH